MSNNAPPLVAFRRALVDLEGHLSLGHWEEAGDAGQTLAEAVQGCMKAGVVLSPDALADAKSLFERCVALTTAWGDRLNKEAQASANTSRALQHYGG
jgi:hypothetical protein